MGLRDIRLRHLRFFAVALAVLSLITGILAGLFFAVPKKEKEISFSLPKEQPQISAAFSGKAGMNGWYVSPVQITLVAPEPSSEYSIDGAARQKYSGSFTVVSDGVHAIRFFSSGNGGGVSRERVILVKIDATAPEASVGFDAKTKTFSVSGKDNASEAKAYLSGGDFIIADEAGNYATLSFNFIRSGDGAIETSLSNIRYNGGKILTFKKNLLKYSWPKKIGAEEFSFSSSAEIGGMRKTSEYSGKEKNTKTISGKISEFFPGEHFFRFETSEGILSSPIS